MQISKINQTQPKTFKGTGVTFGPASWRSSGGGGSYYPGTYGYGGYGMGMNPFMYMWLANRPTYVQNISADDIRKEQQEAAKDKIFLQENPEIIKKKHPIIKGTIAGTITSVAAMLLMQGIEFANEKKIRLKNIDPVLVVTSLFMGALVGLAVKAKATPSIRMERLVREEKSNQEAVKAQAQEEQV